MHITCELKASLLHCCKHLFASKLQLICVKQKAAGLPGRVFCVHQIVEGKVFFTRIFNCRDQDYTAVNTLTRLCNGCTLSYTSILPILYSATEFLEQHG